MDLYNVKIPKNLSLKNVGDIYTSILNQIAGKHLIFDLSDVNFVTPEFLILIVTMSHIFFEKTRHAVLWKNIESNVRSYMDRMNINDLYFIHIEHPFIFNHKKYNKSETLIELSTIANANQIGAVVFKTKEILDRWFPFDRGMCKRHLFTLVKETVENSVEHSSKEPSNGFCYYILQKYSHSDGTVEVCIAVGDIGVGMLASQRRKYPLTKNDAQAIDEILKNGRSGRVTGNGGMGYVNIRNSLDPLNGEMFIRSGKGFAEYSPMKAYARIIRFRDSYPGTQIIFKYRA